VIPEEVALAAYHAHVEANEHDAGGAPHDREIDSLVAAVRSVVDHGRINREAVSSLAVD
jgi:hypothetical protein